MRKKGTYRVMLDRILRPQPRSRLRSDLRTRRRSVQRTDLGVSLSPVASRYGLYGLVVVAGVSAAMYGTGILQRHPTPAPAAAVAAPLANVASAQQTDPAHQQPAVANGVNIAPAPAQIATDATESVPQPEQASAPQVATPQTYEVQDGDTIKSIAARFGLTADTVMWANDLETPDVISVGQQLQIPPTDGVLFKAAGGESLREVADRFHVDPLEVAAYNKLAADPDQSLQAGEVMIPGGKWDGFLVQAVPSPDSQGEVAQPGHSGAIVSALGEQQALQPTAEPTPEKPKAVPIEYTVQDGDTLNSLSLMFGVSTQTLLNANSIDDPDNMTVGTKLTVLPVDGAEYTIQDGETLADIAYMFEVDGGSIADTNGIGNPDMLQVGQMLVIPGARSAVPLHSAPSSAVAAVSQGDDDSSATGSADTTSTDDTNATEQVEDDSGSAVAADDSGSEVASEAAPTDDSDTGYVPSDGGDGIVGIAMAHLGEPYVWGGVGPHGFDCSGFVYYVMSNAGTPVSRGLWGQLNAGPRISGDELAPGDLVFFANTYQPGLSHAGIYIGGGQFIHASDPSTGVTISSMGSAYWSSRFVGASRVR